MVTSRHIPFLTPRSGPTDHSTTEPARERGLFEFCVLAMLASGVLWLFGAALMLIARQWTVRQRLIGILVPPGGIPVVVALLAYHDLSTWVTTPLAFSPLLVSTYLWHAAAATNRSGGG